MEEKELKGSLWRGEEEKWKGKKERRKAGMEEEAKSKEEIKMEAG